MVKLRKRSTFNNKKHMIPLSTCTTYHACCGQTFISSRLRVRKLRGLVEIADESGPTARRAYTKCAEAKGVSRQARICRNTHHHRVHSDRLLCTKFVMAASRTLTLFLHRNSPTAPGLATSCGRIYVECGCQNSVKKQNNRTQL